MRMKVEDDTFRYGYDQINACRRKIAQILARRPALRTSADEDQPLPPFPEWVAGFRKEMGC